MILVSLNISELPITLANRSVICQTEWHVFFNKWIRLYIKVLDYKCSSFLYFYSKCFNCLSVNFWTQISSNKYIKIDIFFKYLINVGVLTDPSRSKPFLFHYLRLFHYFTLTFVLSLKVKWIHPPETQAGCMLYWHKWSCWRCCVGRLYLFCVEKLV